ncbi:hypothetical protein ACFOKJ_09405 [Vogesella amnigena]|uniref:Uncharacterized protein n=1 Tax=Vogesella amnigena TaxID=1507449 RepID=A0ABV7TUF0_9NEIS
MRSTTLAYNTDILKTAPQNWGDFWNVKKFPGKRDLRRVPSTRWNLRYWPTV